ncbi:MAG: DUF58 domain-containing protein [Magnetococcales bacterium]|nr:DUF58 domain-containing protein [Magnetococcales bacterium]
MSSLPLPPTDLPTLGELLALRHAARGVLPVPRRARAAIDGGYRSPFKGRGMEFAETRIYQPGDEIRHMEWRMTARTGKPHVKLFREERERAVLIWTDFRRPMFHATRGRFKVAQAVLAATLAGWSAVLRGDRLGGLIFTEHRHRELRPARGDRAVLEMIREFLQFEELPATGSAAIRQPLSQALMRLRRVALPGSLILMFSDFRGLETGDHTHLAQLARHNDLMLFFLHDPLERELPPPGGRYPVRSGDEARPRFLNVDDPVIRQAYAARFTARLEALGGVCRSIGAGFVSCSTENDALGLLRANLRLTAP